mmetsp:Transcript_762/g.1602  ORF Transcript_762/g.1602 Transcript_762/m.1602 type:complete len:308 (-) Transcript_762:364-1287(-)
MIVGSRSSSIETKAPLPSSSLSQTTSMFRKPSIVGVFSCLFLATISSLFLSPCMAFVDHARFHRQDGIRTKLYRYAKDGTKDQNPVPPVRAQLLPDVLRFRGSVDQGYGRGGKKLGVPTANLPSCLFQNALEEVTTGVYFGWVTLERNQNSSSDSDSERFKAVVNVGYSPTFEGEENKEKIIEAHLIVETRDEGDSGIETDDNGDNDTEKSDNKASIDDFYGVPMRLQLVGFLREEKKFDSFPELIAQIHADVQDARLSLDCQPYQSCRSDPFLCTKTHPAWIGSRGGDDAASWETAPIKGFLDSIE